MARHDLPHLEPLIVRQFGGVRSSDAHRAITNWGDDGVTDLALKGRHQFDVSWYVDMKECCLSRMLSSKR